MEKKDILELNEELMEAASDGDCEYFMELVNQSYSQNLSGIETSELVEVAASSGRFEMLKLLKEMGADFETSKKEILIEATRHEISENAKDDEEFRQIVEWLITEIGYNDTELLLTAKGYAESVGDDAMVAVFEEHGVVEEATPPPTPNTQRRVRISPAAYKQHSK